MTAAYQPQDGSVASRVISYFRRLPDEELSSQDIALKFECQAHDVAKLLARAVDAQFLNRDGNIFSAGPNNKAAPEKSLYQVHTGKAFGGVFPPAVVLRKPANDFDSAAVATTAPINDSPLPPTLSRRGQDKWGPILQRLEKVGQWFALPVAARYALSAAVNKQKSRHPARYKTAVTTAGDEIVIQRVE